MQLSSSELILNEDQSIYHLSLRPGDLADTIITVGDPDRVALVSSLFDHVELRKGKREFITHTGFLNQKRLSVISTGIGTDNIDIVLNELDALVNVDFETRKVKDKKKSLTLVRLGTSGAVQPYLDLDSFVLSDCAIGFDTLPYFYQSGTPVNPEVEEAIQQQLNWPRFRGKPYFVMANKELIGQFSGQEAQLGCTATNTGFYGPQGRRLRLAFHDPGFLENIMAFEYKGLKIANMEMETSGLYFLASLLGHRAVSLSCILANRATGTFSKDPKLAVDRLIRYVLEKISTS